MFIQQVSTTSILTPPLAARQQILMLCDWIIFYSSPFWVFDLVYFIVLDTNHESEVSIF